MPRSSGPGRARPAATSAASSGSPRATRRAGREEQVGDVDRTAVGQHAQAGARDLDAVDAGRAQPSRPSASHAGTSRRRPGRAASVDLPLPAMLAEEPPAGGVVHRQPQLRCVGRIESSAWRQPSGYAAKRACTSSIGSANAANSSTMNAGVDGRGRHGPRAHAGSRRGARAPTTRPTPCPRAAARPRGRAAVWPVPTMPAASPLRCRRATRVPTGRRYTAGRRTRRPRRGTRDRRQLVAVAMTTASAARSATVARAPTRTRRRTRPRHGRRSPAPAVLEGTRRPGDGPRRAATRGTADTCRGGNSSLRRQRRAGSGRGPRSGRSSSPPAR